MKNYKRTLLLATTLSIISSSMIQAGKLTVINNPPEQRIQLCIRGETPNERDRKDCFGPIVEAMAQVDYTVKREHVGNCFNRQWRGSGLETTGRKVL
jgi:hypothetical protein